MPVFVHRKYGNHPDSLVCVLQKIPIRQGLPCWAGISLYAGYHLPLLLSAWCFLHQVSCSSSSASLSSGDSVIRQVYPATSRNSTANSTGTILIHIFLDPFSLHRWSGIFSTETWLYGKYGMGRQLSPLINHGSGHNNRQDDRIYDLTAVKWCLCTVFFDDIHYFSPLAGPIAPCLLFDHW